MKKLFTVLTLSMILATILFAQAPDTLWTRTYGGINYDYGYVAEQTTDGGFIIGGYTPTSTSQNELYLVKTDANGDTLWTAMYGGAFMDYGYTAQQTTDGGYIIAGSIQRPVTYDDNFYVVKTNSTGDTVWTRNFGGSIAEHCYAMQQTLDGGYIFAGRTNSWGAGSYDIYLVKTNANGDTLWTGVYGGTGYDMGNGIQLTSDGGYIITGQTTSYGAGGYDLSLIKVNSSGTVVWSKYYGGSLHDYGYNVQQTTDGGFIVIGATRSFGAGNNDFYLVKTDANGDSLWTCSYGGISTENGYWVVQTDDGGYLMAGHTTSYGVGGGDVWLVKADANGDTLWTGTYGGLGPDYGRSIQPVAEGGYILGGYSSSWSTNNDYDFLLIRLLTDMPPTDPIEDLIASVSGDDIRLDWTLITGATGYRIYYGLTPEFNDMTLIDSVTDNYYIHVDILLTDDKGHYIVTTINE